MRMFFLFLIFVIFLVISVFFLELLDVTIPYVPLSDLSSQIISYWRTSSSSSLLDWSIDSLNLSVLVVELVLHCLLYSFNIFARTRLLLFSLPFYSFKFAFARIFNLFLNFVLIGACMDIVPFKTKMHNELINCIVDFIFPFQIIIVDSIRFCLRIRNHQSFGDSQVKLCC